MFLYKKHLENFVDLRCKKTKINECAAKKKPCSKLHFSESFKKDFLKAGVKVIFNGFIKSVPDMFKLMSYTLFFTLTVDKFYKVYQSKCQNT